VLAAIALAYFTKEQHFSLYTSRPMLAAAFIFMLAFTCLLRAILRWRFPPWAKLGFADIKVNIYGAGHAETEREVMPGFRLPAHLWRYKARITNLEKEQNASLTIRLYLKLVPGSHGRIGEMIGTPADWPIDPSLGLDPLPETLSLAPGVTLSGDLVYEISRIYLGNIVEPRQARLEIEDHISGKRMEKVLEGDLARFTRGDMRATNGGVEILGPEYDAGPAIPGDGGANPPPQTAAGAGVDAEATGIAQESLPKRVSMYRRIWRRVASDHPEAVAALMSLLVAFISVIVAVKALNAQAASNQMASDLQARSFASQLSLWAETSVASGPGANFPQILNVDNRNHVQLAASWLITGVHANVQFTSDGFAVADQISWQRAYVLGHLAPCSSDMLDYASLQPAGNYNVALLFVDDNDLDWYRDTNGLLVELKLTAVGWSHFFAELRPSHVPRFPADLANLQPLSGCP